MTRDPFNDPQPGDVLVTLRFDGARVHVRRRFIRPGWGDAVSVLIDPDERGSMSHGQRHRTWSLSTWRTMVVGGEIAWERA